MNSIATGIAGAAEITRHIAVRLGQAARGVLGIAVLDQVTISLVNLAINFFLVRFAAPEQFGMFGLGYAALMLATGVANAAILIPMSVGVPARSPEERSTVAGAFLRLELMLIAIVAIVLLLAGFIWTRATQVSDLDSLFVAALALALVGWLLYEFGRRLSYVAVGSRAARCASSVLVAGVAPGLLLLYLLDISALHAACMALLGASALAAGTFSIRSALPSSRHASLRSTWNEAWRVGKWMLISVFATWVQSFSYGYLLVALRGTAEVAQVNSGRLLVMLPIVVMTALSHALLPRLVAAYAKGNVREARSKVLAAYGALLAAAGAYVVLLWLAHDLILNHLLHAEYAGLRPVMAAWGVVLLLVITRTALSVLLQAQKQFRDFTLAAAAAAVAGLVSGVVLIERLDSTGAVIAVAISEVVFAGMLALAYLRAHTSRAPPP